MRCASRLPHLCSADCLPGAKPATTCRVSCPSQLSPQYRRHRGSEGPDPQSKVTQLAIVRLGLSLRPEDSAIQVGERATALSSMRCCREFTQYLTSTTDWCQRQGLPALKTKRKVPDQALSRCFKDRHKLSRRRGGRRSIPGWMGGGSLTRRHEAATAVRGQETPRAVGTNRPGLSERHRHCRGLLSPGEATASHRCTWSQLFIAGNTYSLRQGT